MCCRALLWVAEDAQPAAVSDVNAATEACAPPRQVLTVTEDSIDASGPPLRRSARHSNKRAAVPDEGAASVSTKASKRRVQRGQYRG